MILLDYCVYPCFQTSKLWIHSNHKPTVLACRFINVMYNMRAPYDWCTYYKFKVILVSVGNNDRYDVSRNSVHCEFTIKYIDVYLSTQTVTIVYDPDYCYLRPRWIFNRFLHFTRNMRYTRYVRARNYCNSFGKNNK